MNVSIKTDAQYATKTLRHYLTTFANQTVNADSDVISEITDICDCFYKIFESLEERVITLETQLEESNKAFEKLDRCIQILFDDRQ